MKQTDDMYTSNPDAIKRAWAVEIGAQLAEARKMRKLSQQQLSDLSGVPQVTIARIERGTNAPSVSTLGLILSAIGMTMKIQQAK